MDRRSFIQSSTALAGATALTGWTSPLEATPSTTTGGRTGCSNWQPVKILGVGGAGCNIVNRLSDLRSMPRPLRIGRIEETRELDLRLVSTDLSELCLEDTELISRAVAGAQLTIVVAGLGGATGSRVAPFVLKQAKRHGGECIAVYCRPFSFEGWKRWMPAIGAIASTWSAIGRDRILDCAHDESIPEATFGEILACTNARMITAIVDSYLAWLSSPHGDAAATSTEG